MFLLFIEYYALAIKHVNFVLNVQMAPNPHDPLAYWNIRANQPIQFRINLFANTVYALLGAVVQAIVHCLFHIGNEHGTCYAVMDVVCLDK